MQHWYFQNLEETIIAARAQQRRRGAISSSPNTPQYTPNSAADDFENLDDSIIITRAQQ